MTAEERLAVIAPPFYRVDLAHLRARHRELERAFTRRFRRLVIAYSYKTNSFPCILRTLHGRGAWAEVVSSLEYDLARRMGVPEDRIVFNGPVKSTAALERALANGSLVHVDSLEEAERIAELAPRLSGGEPRVGLRVNLRHPEGEGHRAFSRFGIPLAEIERAAAILAGAGVPVVGLHGHLATRARSTEHFRGLVATLVEAAKLLDTDALESIDVGGGFGFAPADLPGRSYPSFDEYAEAIHAELVHGAPELADRTLVIEPGMAMVNDCVRFVTCVESTRQIGGRHLAVLDASVHTVKPTRHGLPLPIRVWDRHGRPKSGPTRRYDLVGYTCMDDDFVAVDHALPVLERGDRLEIAHVGAYTAVFKPSFIRAMPAVHAIDGDEVRLDLPEQSFEAFYAGVDFEEKAR